MRTLSTLLIAVAATALGADRVDARLEQTSQSSPPGRVLLVVVDDLGATPTLSAALAGELDRARTALIRDDDLLAIVSTGMSSIQIELGHDRGRSRTEMAIGRLAAAPSVAGRPGVDPAARLRFSWRTSIRSAHHVMTMYGRLPGPRVLFLITDAQGAFSDSRVQRARAAAAVAAPDVPARGAVASDDDGIADLAAMLATADRLGITIYRLMPGGRLLGG